MAVHYIAWVVAGAEVGQLELLVVRVSPQVAAAHPLPILAVLLIPKILVGVGQRLLQVAPDTRQNGVEVAEPEEFLYTVVLAAIQFLGVPVAVLVAG